MNDKFEIVKVSESAKTLRVTIPKTIAEQLGIKKGTHLKMYVEDGKVIMEVVE